MSVLDMLMSDAFISTIDNLWLKCILTNPKISGRFIFAFIIYFYLLIKLLFSLFLLVDKNPDVSSESLIEKSIVYSAELS